MSYENRELTKKVLNALDPKYILSQDQQEKVTSVFKRFRDKEEDNEEAVEELATAGLESLSNPEKKKGFFQRRAEAARQTRRLGDRYNRQAARGTMPELIPFGDYQRKKQYRTPNPLKNNNPDTGLPGLLPSEDAERKKQYKRRFRLGEEPSTNKAQPQPTRSILQRIGMNKESREKRAEEKRQTRKLGNRYNRQAARAKTGSLIPFGDLERKKKYTPTINPLGNYRFPLRKEG